MMSDELVFQGENPDEKVLFAIHRHPWTLMKPGLMIVFLLLLTTAVFFLFQASWITSWTLFAVLPIGAYVGAQAWFTWANSIYLLTSERVLAVDQEGWFRRRVKELSLDTIMTISHDIRGPWATLLNFGDVNIQAAGAAESDLRLANLYDPYEIQQRIMSAKKAAQSVAAKKAGGG
ncbi:PH domain-containing protein [Candidatus Berkelbacteria bacterium]|nr:PH domain-containing protein [Candidatus Berkelbacteria bacterium]